MKRALLHSLGAAVLVLAVTACGEDGGSDAGPTAPSTTPTPSAEDEALAAFEAYWAEMVEIQNSGEVPEDALLDVAIGPPLEDSIGTFTRYEEAGLVRVGEPRFKDYQARVTGSSGTVTACINEDDWGMKPPGQEADYPEGGWRPVGAEVTRTDRGWLVSGYIPLERVSCS